MKYFIILLTGIFLAGCSMDGPLPVKHDVKTDKLVVSHKKPDRYLTKDGHQYSCYK